MKHLWVVLLLLIYLPNLGLGTTTSVGQMDIADYVIIPYWIAVRAAAMGRHPVRHRDARAINMLLCGFIWWALLGVLAIDLRYDHPSGNHIVGGVTKLAKFYIYAQAALDTRLLIVNRRSRARTRAIVIVAATVLASGLLFFPEEQLFSESRSQGYEANNLSSVTLAIMACFAAGIYADGREALIDRKLTLLLLVLMTFGVLYSQGRGGWFALAAGTGYLGLTTDRRKHFLMIIALIAGCTFLGYRYSPGLREIVDRTLNPDQRYITESATLIGGVDDGARIKIWVNEGKKLSEAPFIGRGFFHRGPDSGLRHYGSHNFWIQMFLETGIIGGLIVSTLSLKLWSCASRRSAFGTKGNKAMRAALVAAFVGGLGGEYFYGGIALFTLFLLIAVEIGAAPHEERLTEYGPRTDHRLALSG